MGGDLAVAAFVPVVVKGFDYQIDACLELKTLSYGLGPEQCLASVTAQFKSPL